MGDIRKDQLVTKEDLDHFKLELVTVITRLINKKSTPAGRQWVKSAEARKLIGVSPGKLQTMRNSGMLPFTKIGGNIYYDRDDLVKLFEDRKTRKK